MAKRHLHLSIKVVQEWQQFDCCTCHTVTDTTMYCKMTCDNDFVAVFGSAQLSYSAVDFSKTCPPSDFATLATSATVACCGQLGCFASISAATPYTVCVE